MTLPGILFVSLYYFQIHLRHLLTLPLCGPVIPFSVALLRCIPTPVSQSEKFAAHLGAF